MLEAIKGDEQSVNDKVIQDVITPRPRLPLQDISLCIM